MMTSGAERCTHSGDGPVKDYGIDMLQREYPASPLVGVGAVIVRDGRVLLVRRGTEPLRGRWSIPGGLIEVGEMLREAVVREAREETGLEVEPVELVELLDRIHRNGRARALSLRDCRLPVPGQGRHARKPRPMPTMPAGWNARSGTATAPWRSSPSRFA